MCLICIEFNQRRDLIDAERMIEAARREADVVPADHLKKVEKALERMKREGITSLDLEEPELDL
jgi:hypothetical protein